MRLPRINVFRLFPKEISISLLLLCPSAPILHAQESESQYLPTPADEAHRTYLENLRRDKEFPSAVSCSQCHPDHFEEWSVSPHAYAILSPVFNSMHAFITDRTGGTNGDFCIRCHTPVDMEREQDIYGTVLHRSPAAVEGVTCVACHRIDSDFGNASGRISITKGSLSDPIYGPTGGDELKRILGNADLGLVTDEAERGILIHKDAIKSPVISRSGQCAMCHDVNSPTGIRLESAFTEFKNSPASAEGTSCQDCHMSQTPGAVLPDENRYSTEGIDKNFAFEPAATIRSYPGDHSEGTSTKPRKRTNHMFIGPDYSIVHPGLFPHSLEAPEITYKARFRKVLADEAENLINYLKSLPPGDVAAAQERAEQEDLKAAALEARKHVYSDWLTFRWWDGWGTDSFEKELSETARNRHLGGVGFPWQDLDDPVSAMFRRISARLTLSHQFNLLNKAHVERTRILRRALQLGDLEVTSDDHRALEFSINVHNATSGHAVPTGFDAERVMYLDVTVHDAQGNRIFQSGDRDPNGDLRDLHSAYVHASEPKSGQWLDLSSWKDPLGIRRSKEDLYWRPDPYLFSLQSKFVARTITGGEREQILALNTSLDPTPFVRPPTRANAHTGRGGGIRKQFRSIPPLSHKQASYRLDRGHLSGARPYRINLKLISQMVPVNLIKEISSVGFDMNLSAKEVANRVAFGHEVNSNGTRKGGAVTIWEKSLTLDEPSAGLLCDFTPDEPEILHVPVSDYPFPHTPEEELKRRAAKFTDNADVKEYMINELGALNPNLWPGGVPEGLSFLPTAPTAALPSPKPEPASTTSPDAPPREFEIDEN